MAAPNWSELPDELLNLISQHFDIQIDLIRFRSVCSNWRFSSIPNIHHDHHIVPFKFPILNYPFNFDSIIKNNITSFCYLSKRSTFLIKPQQQQQQDQTLIRPWLMRFTQNSSGKIKFFQPLLSYNSPPISFHYFFNFNKLSVIHLGTDFIVDADKNQPLYYNNYMYPYPEKVVSVTRHGKKPMILGTFTFSPKPVMFKCGDENWKIIPDMLTCFGDICVFKGRHYVVNKFGRTVRVGPDVSMVELVAEPLIGGGDIKFLVENEGELLLVDIYDNFCFSIIVFRLDVKEKKWVNLTTSLSDRVLFLGNGCSFSASASDLCVSKGNCVIFIDDAFLSFNFNNIHYGNCVFHLDQGRLLRLSDCPEYFNLFLPPWGLIVKCCFPK